MRERHGTDAHLDERGDTLVEVLVTLIVMSITVVSVLFAFSSSIAGSATHRNLVTNDVALRTVAQSVYAEVQQQANPIYSTCASYYGTPGTTQQFNAPTGFTALVTVTGYYYLVNNAYGWQSKPPTDCTAPVPQELLVTLSPSQGSSVSTTIVVNGSTSSSSPFQITSITPSAAPPATTGQYLVITGNGFQSGVVGSFPAGSGITFSGGTSTSPASSPQPSSWTFDSSTSITARIDVAPGATPGPVTFTLTNPDRTKATSTFTIAAGPMITKVNGSTTATQLWVGASNVAFNLTGTNFQSGAILSFTSISGVSSPGWTVASSTSITATVDVSSIAPTGTYQVTVTNPDGQVSNAFHFVVNYPPPTITNVNNGDSGTVCNIIFNGKAGHLAPRISAHDSNVNCTIQGTNFYQPVTYTITQLMGNQCNSTTSVPTNSLTWVSLTTMKITFTNSCGTWAKGSSSTYSLSVTTPGGTSNVYSPAFSISGNG